MPTKNVVLTQHQVALVDRLVHAGSYQNASEVLREGLRLLERREADAQARLAALRGAADIGLGDIAADRLIAFDSRAGLARHLAGRTDAVLAQSHGKMRTV